MLPLMIGNITTTNRAPLAQQQQRRAATRPAACSREQQQQSSARLRPPGRPSTTTPPPTTTRPPPPAHWRRSSGVVVRALVIPSHASSPQISPIWAITQPPDEIALSLVHRRPKSECLYRVEAPCIRRSKITGSHLRRQLLDLGEDLLSVRRRLDVRHRLILLQPVRAHSACGPTTHSLTPP